LNQSTIDNESGNQYLSIHVLPGNGWDRGCYHMLY